MSKILYIGPVRDFSGYATAARGYINALHQAGADIVVRPVRYDQADPGSGYQPTDLERSLLKKDLDNVDVVIQHLTPNEMRIIEGKVNIAVVAWETTRIPQYWVDKLNQFDAVMTFCQDSVKAFRDSGVTVAIEKIPHTFDMSSYSLDGIDSISSPSAPDFLKNRFVFYNISQFSTKKGLDLLLRAYYGAFHGKQDKVVLIFKTYVSMAGRENEQAKLNQYIQSVKMGMRLPMDGYPPVMLITKTLTEEQIKKIHKTGHAYVCSSRGEGWCVPAFEALACGNMLITTQWGGMGEFTYNADGTNRDNVYPVDYSLEPLVGQHHPDPDLYTAFDLVAEPSVKSMMDQMAWAYVGGKKPAPDMQEYDYSVVGPTMLKWILDVKNNKESEVATNV